MPAKTELDATDRRILRILGQDGRASYQAVADEVGLSRPAIMERVKRLEESGYIRGYRCSSIAPSRPAGDRFVAVRYGFERLRRRRAAAMREMEKHPGVPRMPSHCRDDCYILKVVAPDLEGVQEILRDLRRPNSQMNTRTTIVLSTLFEKPGFLATEPDWMPPSKANRSLRTWSSASSWGSTYLAIKVRRHGATAVSVCRPPLPRRGTRTARARERPPRSAAEERRLGHARDRRIVVARRRQRVRRVSEQYVGSGIASIFVVTVAMWTALFDAIIPGGQRELNWRIIAGLLLGFLGTLLLVGATPAEILAPTSAGRSRSRSRVRPGRSARSTLSAIRPKPARTWARVPDDRRGDGGCAPRHAAGEWPSWHLSTRGIGAIAYLVVFGSVLGYSAYSYALRHASATIVGTYAYVNPVIAVLLGWLAAA